MQKTTPVPILTPRITTGTIIMGLVLLALAAQPGIASHSGHHLIADSGLECDENFCAEGAGSVALAAPVTCGTPPDENMVCIDLSGSFGGYSEIILTFQQEEFNPELKGGNASGHLSHMDDDICSWASTPGWCSQPFMDGVSPVHKAWHRMDGTQYSHPGWTNVYPAWDCDSSLPGCPGNPQASFNPKYRYY